MDRNVRPRVMLPPPPADDHMDEEESHVWLQEVSASPPRDFVQNFLVISMLVRNLLRQKCRHLRRTIHQLRILRPKGQIEVCPNGPPQKDFQ